MKYLELLIMYIFTHPNRWKYEKGKINRKYRN